MQRFVDGQHSQNAQLLGSKLREPDGLMAD
jgi:hypothetical protein